MGEKLQPISTREGTVYLFKVFRSLGIDNLNRTWLYLFYSFQLNFTSCLLQLIAFTASYVISSSEMSMDTFLTSLQVAINIYTICIKVMVVYFAMPRLRETGPIFDKLDTKISSKKEREVAEKMIKFCKRLVVIYMTSYFTYSTSTFLAALFNGHPPFSIYIPYCHWQDSRTKLIIASLLEFYLVNVSCLQDVGLDVYAVIFIYMARMHMKILCIRVEQLGKDPTKSQDDNLKTLIDCVDTHRTILELVEIVRPTIAITIFVQLIVTGAIMGITLINIMMFANLYSGIGSMFFFLAVTLETLPLCYTMNILLEEINNLPNSIFHSEWTGQNKTFRQMMAFFMQNARKFNNIIAGNILPIEVSTFLSIAKLGFSIYALVHKMDQRRHAHAAAGIK